VAVNWQRVSAALTALTAITSALGGGGLYYASDAQDTARKVGRERTASVQLLEALGAVHVAELQRAEVREARCWAALHPDAIPAVLANEAEPAPSSPSPPSPPATPADLAAALDGLEPSAGTGELEALEGKKVPKLSRVKRYEWWADLPPQVQALVPGAVEEEPAPAEVGR
jgi:hypothetical protein